MYKKLHFKGTGKKRLIDFRNYFFFLDSFHKEINRSIQYFQAKKHWKYWGVKITIAQNLLLLFLRRNNKIYKHILATKIAVLRIPHLL